MLTQRPVDTTEFEAEIRELKASIKDEEKKREELLGKNADISDSLASLGVAYSKLLSRPISSSVVDSLQKKEIAKGRERYGHEGVKNSQPAIASAFGNRAFDELGVLDSRIKTQTKIIAVQQGISLKKDTLITAQVNLTKQVQKKATKKNLRSFFAGFGGGALSLALLLLLL